MKRIPVPGRQAASVGRGGRNVCLILNQLSENHISQGTNRICLLLFCAKATVLFLCKYKSEVRMCARALYSFLHKHAVSGAWIVTGHFLMFVLSFKHTPQTPLASPPCLYCSESLSLLSTRIPIFSPPCLFCFPFSLVSFVCVVIASYTLKTPTSTCFQLTSHKKPEHQLIFT